MHDDDQTAAENSPLANSPAMPRTAAAERHVAILDLLISNGHVQVTDLAERLSVSEETIRRDLRTLENARRLTRAHGGAVRTTPRTATAADPDSRAFIDQLAFQLPSEGALYLGGDVTVEQASALLTDAGDIEIVVSRIDLAIALSSNTELSVRSLGGEVATSGEQTGEWARLEVERLLVDTAVVFVTGCTEQGELMARPADAPVLSAALRRARRRVLALTSGSIPSSHFTVFAHLSDFDIVVADADAPTGESSPLAAAPSLIIATPFTEPSIP